LLFLLPLLLINLGPCPWLPPELIPLIIPHLSTLPSLSLLSLLQSLIDRLISNPRSLSIGSLILIQILSQQYRDLAFASTPNDVAVIEKIVRDGDANTQNIILWICGQQWIRIENKNLLNPMGLKSKNKKGDFDFIMLSLFKYIFSFLLFASFSLFDCISFLF